LETLFIQGHCSKDYKHRFTGLFLTKDAGKSWILDSAQKLLGGSPKSSKAATLTLKKMNMVAIKEDFHCPYCKQQSLLECSRCHTYLCWDGISTMVTCSNPVCKHTGKIKEEIKHFNVKKGGN
jgi:hypothetical protein